MNKYKLKGALISGREFDSTVEWKEGEYFDITKVISKNTVQIEGCRFVNLGGTLINLAEIEYIIARSVK